jgi:hypothetical protein
MVRSQVQPLAHQPDQLQPWHGRWHRIAIAAIVEQSQVLADVGQDHSLTCGFAVNTNIREGMRIFKTGVSSGPAQAGSISVCLSVLWVARWP